MNKSKIKILEDIETANRDVGKNLTGLNSRVKKHIDRLQNGSTNEQKRGAEITAKKKQEQKEWFYQNIWTVYKIDGIKGIKDILARAVEKGKVSVKELKYTFTMENNKFSKSLSTLQNWHTEFKKRSNDSQ